MFVFIMQRKGERGASVVQCDEKECYISHQKFIMGTMYGIKINIGIGIGIDTTCSSTHTVCE